MKGTCKWCGRKCIRLPSHEPYCVNNPNRKTKRGGNQYTKAKETGIPYLISDQTKKKNSLNGKRRWKDPIYRANQVQQITAGMRRVVRERPESYSAENVCGRVRIIEYNGQKFHGKWEVKVAKWLDEIGVWWKRDVEPVTYIWNGSERLYFPDFYLPEQKLYIEVKGYEREQDRAKWSQFKGNLIIIDSVKINKLHKGLIGL